MKLSLFGEEMRTQPGVASTAIAAVAGAGADIRLITTSEVDISLLIAEPSTADAVSVLHDTFSL